MQWITVMNNTQPIVMDDWYDDTYVVQPGQGALYFLSSDGVNEVVLLDKDGKPFDKPEKRIGFV
jgi:hypothetical protein